MGKSRGRGGFPPPYLRTVIERAKPLHQTDKPGVFVTNVYHDDDCAIFKGGRCTCSPTVGDPTRVPD